MKIPVHHKKRIRLVGQLRSLGKQIGGRIKRYGPEDKMVEKLISTREAVRMRLRYLKLKKIS